MAEKQDWSAQASGPDSNRGGNSGWDGAAGFGSNASDPPFGGWADGPQALRGGGEAWLTPAKPPVLWLVAGTVLAVAGVVLGVLSAGRPTLAGLGWLLGGPLAIALIAVFLRRDIVRRSLPLRVDYAWVTLLYAVAVALALAAVVVSSLRFALWFGRR